MTLLFALLKLLPISHFIEPESVRDKDFGFFSDFFPKRFDPFAVISPCGCRHYRRRAELENMIPKFIQLYGMTRENRHEMIWRVKEAILRGNAYITDFHMFSNTAVCINFEVSVGNLEKLYASLVQEAFLNRESLELLTNYCRQSAQTTEKAKAADVTGTLNITFIHNEPDLRIEVPPIPG